jgi:fructoselysine-6-P-deglycase FrlB-like protein
VSSPADAFLADVLAEPESLASALDAYGGRDGPLGAVGKIPERRVLFVGMGSSRYAALAACSLLRAAGIDAAVEYASAAEATPPAGDRLVVAISASGSTPETVEAAQRHRGHGRVVAVTNDPESPLATAADVTLPLFAGEEAGGIACRTYQSTVAVLLLLCGRMLGRAERAPERFRPAVDAVRELHSARSAWLPAAADLIGNGPVDVVAPAERLSSAEQSALMLREAPRIRAAACETGDWLHVDVYLTRPPGYRAILFPGSRFDGAFFDWIEQRGGAVVAIGSPAPGAALEIGYPGAGDPLVDLLVETSAVELTAAELWRRRLT